MENWYTASVLASFPGHSHSQYRINARDTYNFPAVRTGLSCSWKQLFAVGSAAEVKYKSFEKQSSCRMPILAQSSDRYWNGWADCDSSLHDVVGFYCCHVTKFWNLIGTANFLAAEVTVWTRRSCQAVSPMAWEQGYICAVKPEPLPTSNTYLHISPCPLVGGVWASPYLKYIPPCLLVSGDWTPSYPPCPLVGGI